MNKNEKEWFESEWFWDTFGPIMFDKGIMAKTDDEVEGVIKLTGLPQGSRILDVCCGFGRHSLEFARWGYDVTGMDITSSYIERARKSAKEENLNCNFILGDVRSDKAKGLFSGALCMWNSFGYSEDPEDDEKIIKNVFNSLEPGGFFLLDTPGKEVIASGFEANTWFERDDLKILLEYSIDLNWTVLKNRWLFLEKDGTLNEFSFAQRIFSALEMAQMLYNAGFESIDIYGNWQGEAYDNEAERLIVIAWKG
ncbi:MAG: methyltransferase domain-containing protein [Spirochaetales bacterium]|nr:methyltransferase domain-containing protein [Spirochaetales bacterium]